MTGFVSYRERDSYLLNNVPAPHIRHLTKQAVKRDTSLTNIAGQVLADRYGLEFEQSSRHNIASAADRLLLKLPEPVMVSVRHEAAYRKVTIRTVILDALSDSFGLKRLTPTHVDPARRPGRPREAR